MTNPTSSKVNANQGETEASTTSAKKTSQPSPIEQKVTAIKSSESVDVGKLLLDIDCALTLGCAVGGIIAGLSSIVGIILLSCAAVGMLILCTALAVSHFGCEKRPANSPTK